jgi:hypothetical protein
MNRDQPISQVSHKSCGDRSTRLANISTKQGAPPKGFRVNFHDGFFFMTEFKPLTARAATPQMPRVPNASPARRAMRRFSELRQWRKLDDFKW